MTERDVTARSNTPSLTLQDGGVVEVRPLEPRDRAGLAAAVRPNSDETRYVRFASPKPELTERELGFLLEVDHHSREAILAVDPSTGHGVGVVRYVEVPGEPGAVEIAATVADDWQGRGLGRALLERLTSRARDEGYSTLRANVLAINRRSINLLRRAGLAPHAGSGILREYELALD
jgi:RimJ/RimL family protein N-acetyltransferase